MSHCPRCNNILITQFDETRCYACGYYDNPPYDEVIRDPYDRITCMNCSNKAVKGKKHCEKCLAYFSAYNRQAKLAKMGLI